MRRSLRSMAFVIPALLAMSPRVSLVDEPAKATPRPQADGWQPNPKLLEDLERRKTPVNYRESEVAPYQLPDPLLCEDGTRVSGTEAWERKRRPETLELFRKFVYGRTPSKPSE